MYMGFNISQNMSWRLCPTWASALGLCVICQQRLLLYTKYIGVSRLLDPYVCCLSWGYVLNLCFVCHQVSRVSMAAVVSDVNRCLMGWMHSTNWVIAQISSAQLPAAAIWIHDSSCSKLLASSLKKSQASHVLNAAQNICWVTAQNSNARPSAAKNWELCTLRVYHLLTAVEISFDHHTSLASAERTTTHVPSHVANCLQWGKNLLTAVEIDFERDTAVMSSAKWQIMCWIAAPFSHARLPALEHWTQACWDNNQVFDAADSWHNKTIMNVTTFLKKGFMLGEDAAILLIGFLGWTAGRNTFWGFSLQRHRGSGRGVCFCCKHHKSVNGLIRVT